MNDVEEYVELGTFILNELQVSDFCKRGGPL